MDDAHTVTPVRRSRRLRTRGMVALGIPIVALLVVFAAYASIAASERRTHVRLTEAVATDQTLQQIQGLVVDVETATRGYALTGDTSLLEPVEHADVELDELTAQARGRLASTSADFEAFDALGRDIRARLDLAARVRQEVDAGGREGLVQSGLLEEGAAATSGLRDRVADLQAAARVREAQERRDTEQAETLMSWTAGLAVAVGLVGGIAGAWSFTSGVSRRVELVTANARRLEHGEPLEPPPPTRDDEVDELARVLAVASTELQARQQLLDENHRLLEAVLTDSPLMVVAARLSESDGALGAQVTTLYVSPNVERILGHPTQQLYDDPGFFEAHIHPDDLSGVRERTSTTVAAAARGEVAEERHAEYRFFAADGSVRWIAVSIRPLADQPGVVVTAAVDVTARREAEIAMRRSSDLLQAILDNSPTVIQIKDADGRFVMVNRALCEVTGLSVDEHVGRTTEELFPLGAGQYDANDAAAMTAGRAMHFEENLLAGGRSMTFLTAKFPLPDEQGDPTWLGCIATDITGRIQADDELRAAHEAADQANRAKSEFLSRMSHELRTPLNSLLGFTQLLQMDELTDEQTTSVDQIVKAGRHLLSLIDEVLDIARIEAGRLSISLESVSLVEVVQQALDLTRPLAARREIAIARKQGKGCDTNVRADRQRLLQVLLNLLSNSVKYNRWGGDIDARCLIDGGWATVSISDTGLGMTPEQLSRVFEPFERLDAEEHGIEGTGVGLTLSKRLVELMGGSLDVTSTPGKGTTFLLHLPVTQIVAQPDDDLVETTGTQPLIPQHDSHPLTVLYVEDNLTNLALVERVLQRRPNTRLIPAMQGRLAVELAVEHQPDVVLLDLHLPDMDGADVLRELRTRPALAGLPVIIVSADATPGQIDRLLSAGADAYLTKPLDIAELMATIEEATQGSP